MTTYDERRLAEMAEFREVPDRHALPDIFHYYSLTHLFPKVDAVGLAPFEGLYHREFARRCRAAKGVVRGVSIGSGMCEAEIAIATALSASGMRNLLIDCIELNPHQLERAAERAAAAGVTRHLRFVEADVNTWRADSDYDVAIASHSLHHVVELEHLFAEVGRALGGSGTFIVNDMIGRNGHMRWPEALAILERIWARMPDRYKYNHQLKRFEETYDNWDCSTSGFEGIRAQDILPLLIDRFSFHVFVGFANLVSVFVDRCFGHNLDPARKDDRAFIDSLAALDDALIDLGVVTPTQMIAVLGTQPRGSTVCYRHWSPRHCLRIPDTRESTGVA